MKYIKPTLHKNAGVGHTWLNWMAGRVLSHITSNTEFIHVPIDAPRSGGGWDEFLNFGEKFRRKSDISYKETLDLSERDLFNQDEINLLVRKVEKSPDEVLINLSYNQFPGTFLNYLTDLRSELRNSYWRVHESDDKETVSVHIRRGDIGPQQNEGRWLSNEYYVNIVENLKSELDSSVRFDLISEGREEEFSEFHDLDVNYCLNEDDKKSFHRMVDSDFLVTGLSTYSILASVLSYGKIYYHPLKTKAADFTGWLNDFQNTVNTLELYK